MGLLDFLKKARDAVIPGHPATGPRTPASASQAARTTPLPATVRERLFDAAGAADDAALRRLCRQHSELILAHFESWRTVPEPIRSDPASIERHARGLIAVAEIFVEQGERALMDILHGPEGDNPIVLWERTFTEARAHMTGGAFQRALPLLCELVDEMTGLQGTAIDSYLPVVQGALGEVYYRLDRLEEAYEFTFAAFLACDEGGDVDGVICYCGNLAGICSRMGRTEELQRWLITMTNLMLGEGRDDEVELLRTQYGIEPTNEVIRGIN
ncbi:hypothetical protein [Haliangium ochraceum]|uniref:Uncharacterized protein n=1 Tax=Haliangium ochraceum (strain DSM 14365 / JCM 11303 / SMP-2) TaxID=502025 RepID=D0LYE5_HALO1|nr:hypothetical protein [Haliangium ochraceum]ACY16295.1 hypothetical protein Hoch_3795 [Haliangium ochraceum DSM 14365]